MRNLVFGGESGLLGRSLNNFNLAWKSLLKCYQNGQPVRHFPKHWVFIHSSTGVRVSEPMSKVSSIVKRTGVVWAMLMFATALPSTLSTPAPPLAMPGAVILEVEFQGMLARCEWLLPFLPNFGTARRL